MYDKYDEADAYNRGRIFGQGLRITNLNQLPSNYSTLPEGRIGMSTYYPNGESLTPESLQSIANQRNNIVRYNGATYFPQK